MSEVSLAAGRLQGLWRAYLRRRYASLFYSLLLTLGALPVLKALALDPELFQLFLLLNLFAAVFGVAGRGGWRLVKVFLVVAVVARFTAGWLGLAPLATVALPLWTAMGLLAAAGALRHAMRATTVDPEHVYAALSAYLLAGICFGVLYFTIEQVWPHSLAQNGGGSGLSLGSAIYFSFVTLATIGYGDVVPHSEVTQGLAILEGVGGQMYMAVLVARLVSLYSRRARDSKE